MYNYKQITRDAQNWISANIQYANIGQLVLADADTFIFPFVSKHQVSYVQRL